MGNDQAEFELFHELTSGTGLASPPPPAGFQQPGQQTGVPGANFQNSGTASFQPTAGGQGYHQQAGHLDLPDTEEGLVGLLDDISWKQFLKDFDVPPLPANSTNDPESPYINQWNKIDDLMQNGGALVKYQIDRIWIESSDSLFNLTLRKNFAPVIERMRWDLVNPHDNEPGGPNLRLAEALKRELYAEVQNKLQDFQGNEETRYRLERWNNGLVDLCSSPLNIVQPIKTVLERERAIIELTRNQSQKESQNMQNNYNHYYNSLQPDTHLAWISAISTELSDLEKVSQNACEQVQYLIHQVQQLQVQLRGQLHRIDMIDRAALSPQELEGLNGIVQRRDLVIQNEKTVLEQCYWPNVENLRLVLSKVLDNGIKEYQRSAAYIECGKLTSHYLALDQLQDWVKRLAKIISSNLQQMDKLLFLEQQLGLTNGATSLHVIQELIQNYSFMIEQLVQKGLVVEKHPPQILMKDRRFQCQLRHLVGDTLDIHKLGFRVRVYLINGENAMKVLQDGATSQFSKSGEIINDKATSDFTSTGVLSVSMRTMCLKMQHRGAQHSSEMVAELKFAMLYRTEITVRCLSQQTTVHAQALSMPIVVISHGKQEADAQATIFWDNAFAHINRNPFEVGDSVPWSAMLDALDDRWKFACREGNAAVGLTPQARQFLSMKLFNQQEIMPGTMISWRKFNHDKICEFTFWTWFYKAMELCSCKYVRKYWNLGYIHGFLSKDDCQEMLLREARGRQAGIFIFRFSETQLGAISIACTVKNETDHIQVHNLSPDTVTEFKVRSLPDTVRDLTTLKYLQYLNPNVYRPSLMHKDQAFGSDYTNAIPCPAPGDRYIRKVFVVSTVTGNTNQHQQNGANLEHGPEFPAKVMKEATKDYQRGVPWELLYADDLALTAESEHEVIEMFLSWHCAMERRGLKVNMNKTKFLVTGAGCQKIITGKFPCAS